MYKKKYIYISFPYVAAGGKRCGGALNELGLSAEAVDGYCNQDGKKSPLSGSGWVMAFEPDMLVSLSYLFININSAPQTDKCPCLLLL